MTAVLVVLVLIGSGVPTLVAWRALRQRDAARRALESNQSLSDVQMHTHIDALRVDQTGLERAQRIAQVGSFELDLARQELAWSDELLRLFDYDVATAGTGFRTFLRRVHHADLEVVQTAFERAYDTGDGFGTDFRVVHSDSSVRWLRMRVEADSLAGRIVGLNGVCQDVTEAKLADEALHANETKLAAALEQAQEASRLKSAFLANMSHEIRTPMNAVIGLLGLIRDTKLTTTQQDYVETMNASATSLLGIIDDILDVSKIEAGKMLVEARDYSMRELVEATTHSFAATALDKGITLSSVIDPAVPAGLVGDPHRVGQVLGNLLGNAVKFTARGSVSVRVSVDKKTLRVEVADTGIGISKATQARLFAPFEQGDISTTRIYGGTGLGLSISKELVTLMGGKIGVTSREGNGSTFFFTLPLIESAPTARGGNHKPAPKPKATARKRLRVLVVEDNPVNRKVAVGLLTKLGYLADFAVDGVEGLEAVAKHAYDAILMDCQMPRMDGFDAARALRQQGCEIPIIAMTASTQQADKDACLEAGMDDFLSKPVARDTLETTLQQYIHAQPGAPTAMPADDTPVMKFDPSVLEELRSMDEDGSFIQELVDMYRNDAATDLAKLRAAVLEGDAETTRRTAHRMKGAGGNLGLVALRESLFQMEQDSETNPTSVADDLAVIEANMVEALAYLDSLTNHKIAG